MSKLEGKTALITGASSGIGRETARSLACEGANVVLAARRENRLVELAEEIESEHGVETLVVPTDVSVEKEIVEMVDRATDRFGELDVVVSNAAVGPIHGAPDTIPTEEFLNLMAVNVNGMYFTARSALPSLRESMGNLIFVGSFGGLHPRPNIPIYAASKWWTRGFAQSLAATVGGDGVGVSIINPATTRTGITIGDSTAEELKAPGEATEPETIADAITFMAQQSNPAYIAQLDLFYRDKLSEFSMAEDKS